MVLNEKKKFFITTRNSWQQIFSEKVLVHYFYANFEKDFLLNTSFKQIYPQKWICICTGGCTSNYREILRIISLKLFIKKLLRLLIPFYSVNFDFWLRSFNKCLVAKLIIKLSVCHFVATCVLREKRVYVVCFM